jgi:hypothetical protein
MGGQQSGGQQSGGAAFWLETQNMRRMRTEITPFCSACTVRTASQQGSSLPVRHAGWAFRSGRELVRSTR